MLQALRKIKADAGVAICEVDEPLPGKDEVLLEVTAAGVCGSDVHVADWTPTYAFMTSCLPVTLGHEFGGTVIAVNEAAGGATHDIVLGQRVVVAPFQSCGSCVDCLAGRKDDCQFKQGYLGFRRDGGFCRKVAVPAENCMPVPASLDDESLALIEPITIGAQAVARSGMKKGARVLVVGPGPIGHCIALMAEFEGAGSVAIAGKDDAVRLACLNANGFSTTIDAGAKPLDEAVRAVVGDTPFDIVFDATGVGAIFEPALRLLARGGALVTAGLPARPVPVDFTALSRNQQSIVGTHRAPPEIWRRTIDIVATNPDRFKAMITHRMPLSESPQAFELCRERRASKVILSMQ